MDFSGKFVNLTNIKFFLEKLLRWHLQRYATLILPGFFLAYQCIILCTNRQQNQRFDGLAVTDGRS